MACILNIDTSTDICSICVSENGANIYDRENREKNNHSTALAPMIHDALLYMRHFGSEIEAVAVSFGPGSYTGLRIGVSEAKGLAYGLNVPMISVPTLEILAVPLLLYRELPDNALLCPMVDARRMEVYDAVYDKALRQVRKTSADVVTEDTFAELLDNHPVYFFGNGTMKCQSVISHPNANFIEDIVPLASNMYPLSEKKFAYGDFVDTAYSEPFYLKDFVATTPKKNIL